MNFNNDLLIGVGNLLSNNILLSKETRSNPVLLNTDELNCCYKITRESIYRLNEKWFKGRNLNLEFSMFLNDSSDNKTSKSQGNKQEKRYLSNDISKVVK